MNDFTCCLDISRMSGSGSLLGEVHVTSVQDQIPGNVQDPIPGNVQDPKISPKDVQ